MAKVGVLLSGCGVFDGAEIHESVLLLLALDRAGAEVICLAPDVQQMHVVDHVAGKPTAEARGVLQESARIARGEIRSLGSVSATDMDALVVPGGFGAAKNLCTFAVEGAACQVDGGVARLLGELLDAAKPIGVACIAPGLMAAVLRDRGQAARLTIGNDEETAQTIQAMGSTHVPCAVGECCIDADLRIVSTPAYMLAGSISEAADGLERLVDEVIGLIG